MLRSWLRTLVDSKSRAKGRKNRGFRPVLECLEGRTLPSITLSSTSWTPIGPAPASGPFSGRSDVAAPDPSNPNVMYVGATDGGVWKTTNFLDPSPSWTPLTDLPQVLSLAVHEHDLVVFPGNSNIVLGAASGPGGGILRSDDGGNNWNFFAKLKIRPGRVRRSGDRSECRQCPDAVRRDQRRYS